jgi:hypothetical protein
MLMEHAISETDWLKDEALERPIFNSNYQQLHLTVPNQELEVGR